MKRMLFISINDHVPWGGSEELWSKTSLELHSSSDVNVLVKWWPEKPQPIKLLKQNGVKVFYKGHCTLSFKEKIKKKLFRIKPKVKHDLDRKGLESLDLVVISLGNHLDTKLFYYTDYLEKNNIPFVLVYQLVTDLRGCKDEPINRFKETLLKARKLYTLSKDNTEKLKLQFAHNFENIEQINNPFNFEAKQLPFKNKNSSGFCLALVGAYNSLHKGHDVLLKVLSQDKWKQRELVVNLYGSGHNEEHIKRLVEMYGLTQQVIFNGFVADKEDIWRVNQGCIMPSRMEGQSLAMLEAMSYGRMVISTAVGGAPELIDDNITGFLALAATVPLVDDALERAWEKRNTWDEIGKLSRAKLYDVITEDPVNTFSKKLKALLV
ncbi:glycosyltransferase [Mangrovimonas cancribranchiae]|uniref:Glycosyltransferase n=1 Tax=Mangrovimonas cancribranchiae TaxID=3080055 RepID=A0AAU6P156_9FLAO